MKLKYVVTMAFILNAVVTFSQIKFEKGYILFPQDKKLECFIKNGNWLRSPDEISYKLEEDGDVTNATVNEIKEFGFGDVRFVAADVNIDYTPKDPNKVDYNKHPTWVRARVFLKVIVEGKASLYYFSKKDVERYFFKSESNDSIRQLIYKPYRVTASAIKYNNAFQGQLTYEVACEGQESSGRLEYSTSSLRNYFNHANACRGGLVEKVEVKRKPTEFHLSITPGLDNSSFHTEGSNSVTEYGSEKSARIGLEGEFVLPFNSRKWTIFLEPTYQSYSTSDPFAVDIKSLELPAGVRHYFFLSDKSRIFLNAAAVFNFPLESSVKHNKTLDPTEEGKRVAISLAAGGGFKYSRFGLEARYYAPRSNFDSGFFLVQKKLALILSVRIF